MTVQVEHRGTIYPCQEEKPGHFRCGRCLHGIIFPVVGDLCMSCGTKVVHVITSGVTVSPGQRKDFEWNQND